MKNFYKPQGDLYILFISFLLLFGTKDYVSAQSFSQKTIKYNGNTPLSSGTSATFGPDGRLYVTEYPGLIKIFRIVRNGDGDYVVTNTEVLDHIQTIQDHNDDGSLHSSNLRETIGLALTGTASHPVMYVSSSDFRIGGGGGGGKGDVGLDTNSGIITRLSWNGNSWDVVDIVRGLPRSEENHATNGMEFTTVNGIDYLIVAQGGNTNAGAPSKNFAYTTEYALSAAVLSVNLTMINSMPILDDNGRKYIYDLPTLDDPTRPNVNGITNPDDPGYDGIDVGDPFGGNDGLNQAIIVPGGPVQIFSPGYRNAYDLVVTEKGAVYVTDNGANGGWGGLPVNEGGGNANNDYDPNEPGSSTATADGEKVNNKDHLTLITNDITTYNFGSFYGGHPTPVRANPYGAGLYTNPAVTGTEGAVFRTKIYHPTKNTENYTTDIKLGLPANWPPVKIANPIEGDYRGPGDKNPDGPEDVLVTIWGTNTNAIDEYTASNFNGAMKGDLIAGVNTGELRRVELNPDGSLKKLTPSFASGLGGNALGVTCNGDKDPFPGTIWVVTLEGGMIVLEPQDFGNCLQPGEPGYDPEADYDMDGYTNQDEEDNGTDPCNGGSQPSDHDKAVGAPLISDLNDPDDDSDGIPDAEDPFQLGDPLKDGSDAFIIPVINELFSSNPELKGYMGLGMTGLMNNGDPNPNWLNWLDRRDDPNDPNPNDILGGAIGAMTMHMTAGTALGTMNNQEKGFQYGVQVSDTTAAFTVSGNIMNLNDPLQLYGNTSAPNGELGIFIGDGFQSNYIKFVLTQAGIKAQQEINDLPQTPIFHEIPFNKRPEYGVVFYFNIEPSTGEIILEYSFDNGSRNILGTMFAQGNILKAIQQLETDLAVGLIGTSNAAGVEVEGTWDFLNVTYGNPIVIQPLADLERRISAPDESINLRDYFYDDKGVENLVFSVENNTNPVITAEIDNYNLNLSFPSIPSETQITIRATDADAYFVDESFTVKVIDDSYSEVVVLYRVNAGGPAVMAIDDEMNWSEDTTKSNSVYLTEPGTNNTSRFSMSGYSSGVDLTTTPVDVFARERSDNEAGEPNLTYTFPVPKAGNYEVRLYMGNGFNGTSNEGQRIFDVAIEGIVHPNLKGIDLIKLFGHKVGGVITQKVVVEDGYLDISFIHGPIENPLINGIEILGVPGTGTPIQVAQIPDQINFVGDELDGSLVVNATGGDGALVYTMTGAPAGIFIEPTNGQIGGAILEEALAGSPYNVVVKVDDSDNQSNNAVSISFAWTIIGGEMVWVNKNENTNYTGRHECSFVQAGDRFYLMGGREKAKTVDIYDYSSNSWVSLADSAPLEFNHYQAVEYQGLIWVIGAFKDNAFPSETPADYIYVFDPVNEEWIRGPEIPENRRRGSASLVMYDGKFYITGGNTKGHDGGYVAWFDVFDPSTGTWTALANAPRARDHFHSVVIDNKLYAAGGRLSGGSGGTFKPLIPEVDVYDFGSGTWSTLPNSQNIPTPRAAASAVNYKGNLLVIGGEVNNEIVYGETLDDALKITEEYNPQTGTWTRLPDLNFKRHGTQAFVSGEGIYTLAGSPSRGGGSQKNMEYYGIDAPAGEPGIASTVTAPEKVLLNSENQAEVLLEIGSGNTGVIITSLNIQGTNANEFIISSGNLSNSLLHPNSSHIISVEYTGSQIQTATLMVNFGAAGQVLVILESSAETSPIQIAEIENQQNFENDHLDGSLIVAASGGVGELVYSMTGAPAGVSLDSITGVISGIIDSKAAENSPYLVTVTVDDSDEEANHAVNAEFTWTILSDTPFIVEVLPDLERFMGSPDDLIDLKTYFDDNNGVENLTFSITENTDPVIVAGITGNILNLSYPGFQAVTIITIRATDAEAKFVEQSFTVSVIEKNTSEVVVLYRVNAGGPAVMAIDDDMNWSEDTSKSNSVYLTEPGTNNTSKFSMSGYSSNVDLTTTPVDIFARERSDNEAGEPNLTYTFPVPKAGNYEVRLYMGNGFNGTSKVEQRIFDVSLEGIVYPNLNNIDLTKTFGHRIGGVITQTVLVEDGFLDISFIHGAIENPLINGIEILGVPDGGTPIQVVQIPNQSNYEGDVLDGTLRASATGGDGPMVYSMAGAPAGVVINSSTGVISGTIGLNTIASSPYNVTVTVNDSDGEINNAASTLFTWTILDGTPVIVQALPDLERFTGSADEEINLNNYFDDNDGVENLTYTVQVNTNQVIGAGISGNILLVSFPNEPAITDLTIRATDANGKFVEQTFKVTVTETSGQTPIEVAQIPNQSNYIGDVLDGSLVVNATGGDGALVYSMTGSPAGVIINSATGLISGTIDIGAAADLPYAVIVTVDDSDEYTNDAVSTSFSWKVSAGEPIITQVLPDIERVIGAHDDIINLNNYFDDNDGVENLTYTVAGNSNNAVSVSISGSILTIGYPNSPTVSSLRIRATDAYQNYVEQTFTVTVTSGVQSLVLYRVNTGGPAIGAIDGETNWGEDTSTSNSPYLTVAGTNSVSSSSMNSYTNAIDRSTTPLSIFQTERTDGSSGVPNMTYSFPISTPGSYQVRLYMGNSHQGTARAGQQIFDVQIEGVIYSNMKSIDLSGTFGHKVGAVLSQTVEVSDGMLNVVFIHGAKKNPIINGIEIINAAAIGQNAIAGVGYNSTEDQYEKFGLFEVNSALDTSEYEVQIFPNPASSFANLKLSNPEVEVRAISLYSYSGQLIRTQDGKRAYEGNGLYTVDVSGLPEGVYVIKLSTNFNYSPNLRLVIRN